MTDESKKILFSTETLRETVQRLARQITEDYRGKDLLMVGVLKGSFVFLADLARAVDLPCEVDFLAASSYGSGTASSGNVTITHDLSVPLKDRDVLVVEDIVDSGHTLAYLMKVFASRSPRSLRLCTLLDKPSRREAEVHPDYVGLEVGNQFIVGYGLDYDEKYRNLPYISVLGD